MFSWPLTQGRDLSSRSDPRTSGRAVQVAGSSFLMTRTMSGRSTSIVDHQLVQDLAHRVRVGQLRVDERLAQHVLR